MTATADEIAQILIAGERDRTEVPQISQTHGDPDLATAYAAQRAFVQSKLDAGDRLRRIQTGKVQDYVFGVGLGLLALMAWIGVGW